MTADKVENSGSPPVIDGRYSEQFEFFPQACYGQPGGTIGFITSASMLVASNFLSVPGLKGNILSHKIPEADDFATTGGDMSERATRREFLKLAGAGGAAMGLGGWSFLGKLPSVSAQEARLDPARVVLDASIAPLVKLLE